MIGRAWEAIARYGSILACAFALAALGIGAYWGTYVAGGPDSYCYLNQAELFARGRVRDPQPLVRDAPWPNKVDAVVPDGHTSAPNGDFAVVPICPSGYPAMLAVARVVGGRTAMFWVVPIFGALAVWWAFLIGRRVAGAQTGVMAAALLASSPAFLYQIVQPMSDVPAAAMWTLALVVALAPSGVAQAALSGAASGAAVVVRPNLAPLVLVTAAAIWSGDRTAPRFRRLVAFGLGALPFALVIMALQNAMYGGPFKSGYGSLGSLFSIDHLGPNLARYPVWLLETQTPIVLLALVAPWMLPSSDQKQRAWWLLAFAALTFACYLPYSVFDAWWFLRFVLPAFPALLVLASAAVVHLLTRGAHKHAIAYVAVIAAVVTFQIVTAERRAVFQLRDLERRYRDTGEYVARKLPPNAVVITTQQSGSVRFYSGRQTIVWDVLGPEWLDPAVDFLQAKGLHPYFLFEMTEDSQFKQRFTGRSRWGALDWPPMAQIGRDVRLFDVEDYERFQRGEKIETDFVWGKK
jgi:hypothetical protein